jgi:apolipoprotein N-acyltransferase
VWGSARLYAVPSVPTRTVAAVVTDLGLSANAPYPSESALAENTEVLFARTERAAAQGAQLVAWNEAAAFVEPEGEAALTVRAAETAQRLGIDLVIAYAVLESREPLMFSNRWAWFDAQGARLQTYDKHHPVPGEPSIRGTEPIRVVERPWGKVGAAICYDYDFPALAQEHGRQGAVLAVVPSSDWLGIDPYHTWMARVRAIEQGFSLLRPVRWATSAAYDGYGRPRAAMSAWEDHDRVMVATVPITQVRTWYTRLGDAPTLAVSGALLLLAAGASVRGRARAA